MEFSLPFYHLNGHRLCIHNMHYVAYYKYIWFYLSTKKLILQISAYWSYMPIILVCLTVCVSFVISVLGFSRYTICVIIFKRYLGFVFGFWHTTPKTCGISRVKKSVVYTMMRCPFWLGAPRLVSGLGKTKVKLMR